MWVMIDAYIDYDEQSMDEYQKDALAEYGTRDADNNLLKAIKEKMAPMEDRYIDINLSWDSDLYGDEFDPGWFGICMDDIPEKEALKIAEEVKNILNWTNGKNVYQEYYTDRYMGGGYPSYDPPEYEMLEFQYCAYLVLTDNIRFEFE